MIAESMSEMGAVCLCVGCGRRVRRKVNEMQGLEVRGKKVSTQDSARTETKKKKIFGVDILLS